MATTFGSGKIEDLIGGRKSDVLNQPAGGQPQNSPEAPGFKAPIRQKSNAGFAGGAAAPTKSSEIATGQANNAYLSEANQNVVKSNIIDKNVNTIKSATEKQKADAAKYVTDTSQQADAYNIDDNTFSNATSGYDNPDVTTSVNKVKQTLGSSLNLSDWNPNADSGVDVSRFADPTQINNMESQAANQKSGGQYTTGMSRLDAALRGAANLDYNKVFQSQNEFDTAGAEGKVAADAAKTGEIKQLDEIKNLVKSRLGEKQAGISKAIADRKAAEITARQNEAGRQKQDFVRQLQAQNDAIDQAAYARRRELDSMFKQGKITRAEMDRLDSEIMKVQQEAASKLQPFTGYNSSGWQNTIGATGLDVNDSDVTSQANALSFNRINEMLGTGTNIQAGQNQRNVQIKAPVVFTPELNNKLQTVLKMQPQLIPVVQQIIQEMNDGRDRAEGPNRVTSSGRDQLDVQGYEGDGGAGLSDGELS